MKDSPTADDSLFLYCNERLSKNLIPGRIQAAGERVGVKVYPHRLRHKCATQLLNAGCRVTSIQKFLGHKRLNSTMIYARVHDRTVADDYYAAMDRIEQRIDIGPPPQIGLAGESLTGDEREQLLALAVQLAEPNLSVETRLELVDRMCLLLKHRDRG